MYNSTAQPQEVFLLQAHGGVGQDIYAPGRVYKASGQPVPPSTPAHTGRTSPKHHGSQTRQTEQIAGWVLPHIKSEVRRIEKLKGWSQSKTVATMVEQALAHNIGEQFAVMIRATIQDAVKKEIQSYRPLTVQSYYSAEESRILIIRLLGLLLKDIEELPDLIARSQKQARDNLKQSSSSRGVEEDQSPWPSSS
jgi:hypothetical protein